MFDFFQTLSPVLQALVAGCFTWAMTAVGAAVVFSVTTVNRRIMDFVLGFASGVMIAVSFWGLLAPAVVLAGGDGVPKWLPAAAGFALGGVFLRVADRFLPHVHGGGCPAVDAEGVRAAWRRTTLLVTAMTLHNIPEGLAIGVAFGAAASGVPAATLPAALVLALGIGIQNFPEGMAVSVPMRCEGQSRMKSWWYGQASALVEPFGAVIGAAAVLVSRPLLPYALGFAAGAMIFVVIEELVPESQRAGHKDLVATGVLLGFVLMMVLDTALA